LLIGIHAASTRHRRGIDAATAQHPRDTHKASAACRAGGL
jgi:hypothetical protein